MIETPEQLKARIAELEKQLQGRRSRNLEFRVGEKGGEIAELEKQLQGRRSRNLEFRVGEKGGVSVYGLGRFPVTLYYEQWIRLLDAAPDLRNFLEEHKNNLKLKQAP